ncbi:YhgE/Pip domain-containing protein [Ruminococcus bromii]|uniref:YhgE/Pip domain-containing protein n=1 Tax=Ruminococcus bromii TaxID=40518 RepID=A0ABT0NIQ0_9FIRM|nr:YhgE/Pip domain-containing protein [Ruminococcus bromii]MCL3788120.1 YhgE/Pip domain-containing protein [Ruminococcus bromii]MDR3971295.1 YhgE/Pip domain-containing protein [Ruminococcus sp.]
MVKQEWKSLWRNKILMIVLVFIIAIPAIYTTLFLGSMWDPYGKLDELPVAVVNLDEPVEYEGETLNVGQKLVDKLKDDGSLCFNFTDADQAERGLKNGTYYMVITVPKNFSENATTLMDTVPKKMELDYKTNPGTNYIAMKMSETALEKIKTSVAQEVTKTYAETIFDKISEAGDGMKDAADGAGEIYDGTEKLSDGNKTISDNLKTLSEGTLTFKDGTSELKVGLSSYLDGVNQLSDGSTTLANGATSLLTGALKLNDGANSLSDGTKTLTSGTATLESGAKTLESGLKTYTDGVKQANDGAAALNSNSVALTSGAQQLTAGNEQLSSGSAQILGGLNQMSSTVKSGLPSEDKITELSGGLDTYSAAIGKMNDELQNTSLPSEEELAALNAVKTDLTNSLTNAGDNAKSLYVLAAQLQASGDLQTAAQVKEIADSLAANVTTAANDATAIGAVFEQVTPSLSKVTELKSGVAQLNENKELVLGGAKTAVSGMYSGLANVSYALDTQIIPGMSTLDGGISQVSDGAKSLSSGLTAYTSGVAQVGSGLTQLNDNSAQLNSGATQLSSGASQLSSGAKSLDSGADELKSGTNQLADGTKTLDDGTKTLTSGFAALTANNSKLTSGANQLADGAVTLNDGAGQLYDGSITLGNGLSDLKDGANTLKTGLEDGQKTIDENKGDDAVYEMISSPVKSNETKISNVENNGHAMAAYMMCVGLWVLCIAFCIMYPLTEHHGEIKSGFSWWLSKAGIAYLVALVAAYAMIGSLQLFLHFEPTELLNTFLVAGITAIAFMSILYFFNVWLGKVGSFLMLIFMVVQLAGSAGTYPIEISGDFVATIHKWLPFSYAVDAFRGTISGNGNILEVTIVLLSIAIIFTLLTIMMFNIRAKMIKNNKKGLYDFIEKCGLA